MQSMRSATRLLTVIFSLLFSAATAQDYLVVGVKGNIKSKKNNKTLRPGDLIPESDLLTFKTADDFVTLYTKEGTRKIARYPETRFRQKNAVQELPLIVADGAPSSLPIDPFFAKVEDAKKFFSERGFILFGPESRIKVPKSLFPLSKALFFYVNYDFKEDNVDKKVDYKADSVIFIKKNIFKIDGKEVDGKFAENWRLYYYFQPKNKHTFLGKFKPVFPVDERLKEETDVLVNMLKAKNATDETIVVELAGYMNQHYGNMIADDFRQWVAEQYPKIVLPKFEKAVAPVSTALDVPSGK